MKKLIVLIVLILVVLAGTANAWEFADPNVYPTRLILDEITACLGDTIICQWSLKNLDDGVLSVASPDLPDWATLDPNTGMLTFTPQVAGIYHIPIDVTCVKADPNACFDDRFVVVAYDFRPDIKVNFRPLGVVEPE